MVNESRPGGIRQRQPLRNYKEVSSATSKTRTSNDTTEEFSFSELDSASAREDGYDEEYETERTDRSFNGSSGRSEYRKNFKSAKDSPSPPLENSKASAESNLPTFLIGIVVVGLVLVSCYFVYANNTAKRHCDFKSLREQHREQSEDVWRSLRVGIENILNKVSHTPAVYLMVYREGRSVNVHVNVKRLIRGIASESSKCFGGAVKLVEMSADDFNSEKVRDDFGYAIEKFKSKMENGKVALIVDLNEIPAETARALHVICDTVSPLVSDVVIFLTLRVPAESGTSIRAVEGVLHQLWGSKLTRNELDPLITRVTDQIVQIKN